MASKDSLREVLNTFYEALWNEILKNETPTPQSAVENKDVQPSPDKPSSFDDFKMPEQPLYQPSKFDLVIQELLELHRKKGRDYDGNVQYQNYLSAEDWGIPAWKAAMIRASDKMSRIQTFAREGQLANESVEDSFKDLAIHSLIALILFRETQ